MPARPLWSQGCFACRRMKVKCDETKPECLKCQRGKRKCPGYRTPGQVIFKNMNVSTLAKAHASTNAGNASLTQVRPATDWEQFAVKRFCMHFVESPSKGGLPGYLEFLPQILGWKCPSFHGALLAVSLASLANVSGMQHLLVESRKQYGRALRILHDALNDTSTAASDGNLLAVVLLQKYEIIAGTGNNPHEAATTTMLRLRAAQERSACVTDSLARVVQIRKEIYAMNGLADEPGWDEKKIPSPSPAGNSLRLLLREVAIASAHIKTAMSKTEHGTPNNTSLLGTLHEAVNVYSRLLLWPSSLPAHWRCRPHIVPDGTLNTIPSENKQSTIFLFTTVQHGAVWTAYFSSRIQLSQILLQGYQFLGEHCDTRTFMSGQDLREVLIRDVADMCACAPYLLGDVDEQGRLVTNVDSKSLGAFFLVRGLSLANSVEDLPPRTRQTILDLYKRIGGQFGIKSAWNLREEWLASHRVEADQLSESHSSEATTAASSTRSWSPRLSSTSSSSDPSQGPRTPVEDYSPHHVATR